MNTAVRVHQERMNRIRRSTSVAVVRLWDQLPDLNKPQAEPFARNAARIVAAGQLLAARSTAAYITQRTGIPAVHIDPKHVTGEAVRKGTKPIDVYQRPFGIVWSALGDDVPLEQAKTRGRDRLSLMAATDIFLAMRATSAIVQAASDRQIVWVRVADSGACDLCQAADGTPYDQADDMAGHPNCGCSIDPQESADTAPADPGAVSVHESDELGPVLYESGHSFEGA